MTKITNAQFDTEAAAVPSPFGPLVRVTDVDVTHPDPNQAVGVLFDTAVSGVQVTLTWEQITNDDVRDAIIAQQFPLRTRLLDAVDLVNTLDSDLAAITNYDYSDYKDICDQVLVLAQTLGVINW